MQIILNLQGHKLLADIRQILTSGSKNVDEFKIFADETWSGFEKNVMFCVDKNRIYSEVDNITQIAKIPPEALENEAIIVIGVIGTKDESVMTSSLIHYKIEKGAIPINSEIEISEKVFASELGELFADENEALFV